MKRFVGLVAMVLGIVGLAVAIIAIVITVRLSLAAVDTTRSLIGPVESAMADFASSAGTARERIGENASTRQPVHPEVVSIANAIRRSRAAIETLSASPAIGLLPIGEAELESYLATLDDEAAAVAAWAEAVDSGAGDVAEGLRQESDEAIGKMVSGVDRGAELVAELERSLIRWIRIGSVSLALMFSWFALGQLTLVMWGRRALSKPRGRHAG